MRTLHLPAKSLSGTMELTALPMQALFRIKMEKKWLLTQDFLEMLIK